VNLLFREALLQLFPDILERRSAELEAARAAHAVELARENAARAAAAAEAPRQNFPHTLFAVLVSGPPAAQQQAAAAAPPRTVRSAAGQVGDFVCSCQNPSRAGRCCRHPTPSR